VRRAIGPGDIGVLFRTRESHVLFEAALGRRGVPYYVYKGLGFFDAEEIKDVLALVSFLADPASHLRAAAFLRSRIVRISDEGLKLLAPDLAGAITGDPPAASDRLAADDRERLRLVRESAGRWIDLADQLPPSELVDLVLAESAYAVEIAGGGFAQARENLKKIRGLIRRIQNRGYVTLGRLSDYFAGLVAGGDESNAIIDAADAVNLMTVHAAKGLEFPVVFIVNLGKGSGGSRDDVRVAPAPFSGDEDEDGEPQVTITDHERADERDDDKDHEETKRLLYVALTRARDRLYLAATVTGDRVVLQRGSLGKVLPPALPVLMASGDASGAAVWPGASGPHVLRRISVARVPEGAVSA
jgi:ATP-dependent helicase/nuclease subunit A